MTTMNANEVARALSLLVRSDDEALAYYSVRARVGEGVPVETLKWWRQLLMDVAAKLEAGDSDALQRYQDALEAVGEAIERETAEAPSAEPAEEAPPAAPCAPQISPAPPCAPQVSPAPPMAMPVAPAPSPVAASAPVPPVSAGMIGRPSSVAVGDAGGDVDGTSFLTVLELDDAGDAKALPFEGSKPAPTPATEALAAHPNVGETAFVDVSELQAELAVVDIASANSANAKADVDTYAAIVAQVENVAPEQRGSVYDHYGIDLAQHMKLEADFAAQFQADRSLKARFEESLKRWREWLEARGG